MEPAIRQTVAVVAIAHGGIDPARAESWQSGLAAEGRYLADIWSSGSGAGRTGPPESDPAISPL